MQLPEECWELIFKLVGHPRYFEPLSLVCRQFLAISNQLRASLTVSAQTAVFLPVILRRFQHLREIKVGRLHADLTGLLYQIARSGLNPEALNLSDQRNLPLDGLRELGLRMKNLRSLNLSGVGSLQDIHLFAIASSFPVLEKLDISYPHEYFCSLNGLADSGRSVAGVTDSGVTSLSMKLKNLIKIDLSGNHFITDKSLIALSSNCALLREIAVQDCAFITENGITFVIRYSPELRSISASEIRLPSIEVGFKESFIYAEALCVIDFSNSCVRDEMLYSIVEACLPLNKLTLAHCHGFTFAGISLLLTKYQSLSLLNLEGVSFLTDQNILELSKFLSMLTSINLSQCSKLTNSTFFTLMSKCHLLNEVKMESTNLGEEDFTLDVVVNPRLNSLNLAQNGKLGDATVKNFVAFCPNLQLLNLSSCSKVTGEGVVEIFKRCGEIRHLEINWCSGIKEFAIDFEHSKLEEMSAEGSGINDDALALMGKRSCRLRYLNLAGCLNVTTKGVKEVMQNCRVLREINLKWCDKVNVDIVGWMVFSRPSLRKLIPPCGFALTQSQRNLFLRHGCLVCEA